ncbi:hypothetical protein LZ318_01645 [Saccharopolyspora indica]|uniref:hypothetical protein n=1 Tax=Saccharopolyspora indica TaxID=1229659 RepID=UPI0022EA4361|nr:hypothetical protein [Saccharopolyspora indica]MDA3650147.1 hypothetical protein [Saccharopolyspora indica]
MDEQASGAARMMGALHDAAKSLSTFGYDQYLTHPSVRWHRWNAVGGGVDPLADVGVVFDLEDGDTQVCCAASIRLQDGHFVITADVTVDDPLPGGAGDQRFLLDLPELRTTSLDECLAALRDYTARLCAHTSVLDDLGVPRADQAASDATS